MPEASTAKPVAQIDRKLKQGQRAELHVVDLESGESKLIHVSKDLLFEAPNWHPGGRFIVVNADGLLFRLDVESPAELIEIKSEGLPDLNNDHLISPDGRTHFVSAMDWHIYRFPWEGGEAERVTADKDPGRRFRHFLHGISPDGKVLAYVGTEQANGSEWGKRAVWLLDLETGVENMLADGFSPADGPEFSPDGRYLYFNSEMASQREGHAQLFSYSMQDGKVERLITSDTVDWFPHPSPDGHRIAYLQYPPGTVGHPPDLPVSLKVLEGRPHAARELAAFTGGQGTINVGSWAPDSRRLAYVAYPIEPA